MKTQSQTDPFLAELDVFLASANISDSRLGRDVMGDPNFMRQVRAGRSIRPATVERLRTYMRERAG